MLNIQESFHQADGQMQAMPAQAFTWGWSVHLSIVKCNLNVFLSILRWPVHTSALYSKANLRRELSFYAAMISNVQELTDSTVELHKIMLLP